MRSRKFHNFNQFALRPWYWELLSWLSALCLLTAIFATILQANGKPQSDWVFPITLNSLSATLSTLYRAVLVAIAAQIISQDKWIWYWKLSSPTRPLRDLQRFEEASRGMWGAITLIPIVARKSPSTLIAIIIVIVSLVIGPFVQQSIRVKFDESPLELGTASLPVSFLVNDSKSYFRTLRYSTYGMWDLEATSRGSLFSTLTNPSSKDSTIVPSCTTGNCTFPSLGLTEPEGHDITHSSIGVCNICTDVSSLVTRSEGTNTSYPTYSLPNGISLIVGGDTPYLIISTEDRNLSWAEKAVSPESMALSTWAFANATIFTMAARNESEEDWSTYHKYPSGYAAVTCSLYPCLQSYTAFVRNGRLSESLVQSIPLYLDISPFDNTTEEGMPNNGWVGLPQSNLSLTAIQSPCRVNNTIYTSSNMSQAGSGMIVRIASPDNAPDYPPMVVPEQCVYRFGTFLSTLIGSVIQKDLNGTCTWDPRQGDSIVCGETWWLTPFWEKKRANVGTIIDRISTIANAMTNSFRLGLATKAEDKGETLGIALQTIPYTVIEWQWLILPTILLALETVILLRMLIRSWRFREEEMAWKSNILSLLFYRNRFTGADGNTDAGIMGGPLMTAEEMEKSAAHIRVKLERGSRQVKNDDTQATEEENFKRQRCSTADSDQGSFDYQGVQSEED